MFWDVELNEIASLRERDPDCWTVAEATLFWLREPPARSSPRSWRAMDRRSCHGSVTAVGACAPRVSRFVEPQEELPTDEQSTASRVSRTWLEEAVEGLLGRGGHRAAGIGWRSGGRGRSSLGAPSPLSAPGGGGVPRYLAADMPAADHAVRCSCSSASSCPPIGTLDVAGHRSEPVYCNQLNGSENPGVVANRRWYFQCVELANRWLVDGLGAPRIEGNADEMCDNADRASYDVHPRGTAHEPVPGDLLVWSGHRFGHVGVVTSVSSKAIAFASQNYGAGGLQYPLLTTPRAGGFFGSPHGDRVLSARCIIHPKNLKSTTPAVAADPCAGVSPAHEGKYCGGSRQSGFGGGDASTLYTCRGGSATAARCRGTCTLEPAGRDDHCS